MQVLEQTEIKLDWTDINKLVIHPYSEHNRSQGTHLTDILRKVAIHTNQLKDEDREDEMPLRVFLGMAWEAMCVRLYPQITWQPGEWEKDGIVGSPDGYSPYGVEEFKYTAKSCRVKGGKSDELKDICGEWMWMHQVMGYCNMIGFDTVRMHVCWSRGNYEYPLTERYIRYLVKFSQTELSGSWKMIMKYKYK